MELLPYQFHFHISCRQLNQRKLSQELQQNTKPEKAGEVKQSLKRNISDYLFKTTRKLSWQKSNARGITIFLYLAKAGLFLSGSCSSSPPPSKLLFPLPFIEFVLSICLVCIYTSTYPKRNIAY